MYFLSVTSQVVETTTAVIASITITPISFLCITHIAEKPNTKAIQAPRE